MEKELHKLADNKGMQDAIRFAFESTLEDEVVSRVFQGLDVVGYKEAREIMRQTLKRITVEYATPSPNKVRSVK